MVEELFSTQTYTYDEVLQACLKYFKNDELAATTWINKYAVKDKKGKFFELTPDDMHRRMAREFARMEAKYADRVAGKENLSEYGKTREFLSEERIFQLFKDFKYSIPQGSVMAALGNDQMIASLSNCVVVPPVYDSYGGILHTDQQLVQLFKRRCGVGVDLSGLRPNNAQVSNAAGTTTGAVSFMERFSNTTREVAQNGRRGALMLTIDVAHPDVEDFITIKQDLKKVTGANISLRLSDEFMQAVTDDADFTLRWPIDSPNPKYTKKVRAKELWDTIIRCAHNTAEPGLIFWDKQHTYSTSSFYPGFKNSSTNPCSEIAMQGGDSCRLIAVNLYNFVDNPFTENASFNHEKFYKVIYETQRLMDDLVDLELEAVEKILAKIDKDEEPDFIKKNEIDTWKLLAENGKNGRRTGLGFTALADAVAALGVKFDTDEALEVVDKIMQTKLKGEFDSSIDMAITREPFKVFDPAIEEKSDFVQMMKREFPGQYNRMMQHGRRNISISTVAPTGSLSMLAQTSSGIEPVFMLSYKRRRKVNASEKNAKVAFVDDTGDAFEEFTVYHPKVKTWMDASGKEAIEESPYAGATASEINWQKRVEMQALVQKYTTHSISSTINLASDVTTDKVSDIYIESWRQGLKGITVYRDGSRSGILVSSDDKKDKKADAVQNVFAETYAPKRPKKLESRIIRFNNESEKWLAVVGILNDRPYEIFTGKMEDVFNLPNWVEKGYVIKNRDEDGNSRYDFQFCDKHGYKVTIEGLSRSFNEEYWNYAKLISGVLRHGMPIPYVVDLINNLNLLDESINTWKAGVVRALKQFVPDGTPAADKECGECGDPDGIIFSEGCLVCKSCGYSKCG
ncbi:MULTISPECIES: adenosylcobalamin-dependent ribonucleoside-diphosphate reductase [Salinimicrobium]|jgi:ribonucleoside-diphosphate reductase alpha chain|uniref:Vitamin B12-dependent ribonucleotide reductase n=1 Tax=Salinimicrobium profundisediminis TaxID=2994553 RepID=A0A9X3I1M4_9FLAO|nr:adenosylcobalamin-dependent ribonucleoside-diphosphate reductase [Salinimicrobium profundisediminis]MCX2838613.1 adenosylcobalamin-dependent ribonucleoside-diphosphate reductase [Salinimicrobium profundisediminis]